MKMKTYLFSGIAVLAIAGAAAAFAQTKAASPATMQMALRMTENMPSGGQPMVPRHMHHHRAYRGESGPQYSTPAEHAATDRLNEQQLQQTPAMHSAMMDRMRDSSRPPSGN